MISRDKATEVAKQHLSDNPLPSSRYRWILAEPVQTDEGWIFEYSFECVEDIPPEEWECFGGAPGFIVYGDGLVRDLTFSEMPAS